VALSASLSALALMSAPYVLSFAYWRVISGQVFALARRHGLRHLFVLAFHLIFSTVAAFERY
jgi:hypothetical protein